MNDRPSVFESLPPDLLKALRDTPIGALPGDIDLERILYVLDKVTSNTASAMSIEDWKKAWAREWQRANRAEAELEELREDNERRDLQRKASPSDTASADEDHTRRVFESHVGPTAGRRAEA
jgi:hypothetical protein